VAAVDQALQAARTRVEELEQTSEFMRRAIAAQNDDRGAFDQLEVWGNDPEYPLRAEAAAAWREILDQHASPIYSTGFTIPWADGVDPAKLTLAALASAYAEAPTALRPALIEYVWGREDTPLSEKKAFLVHVLESDTSLGAVEYAGRLLASALGSRLKPLAVRQLLEAYVQQESGKPSDPHQP
jgi:hypothetical protein